MKLSLTTLFLLCFIQIGHSQYSWTPAELHLKSGKILEGESLLILHDPGNLSPRKEVVSFRTSNKEKKQKIEAKLIKHIFFTISYTEKIDGQKIEHTVKEKYIPLYLNKKKKHLRFVQLIIDGKVKLLGRRISSGGYYGIGPGNINTGITGFYTGNHNQLLLAKGDDIPTEFSHKSLKKSFKKRAIAFFNDCKSLVSKLEEKIYKKEDLIAIAEYYNNNCQ